MNDLQRWLESSSEKATFFLIDLTRRPTPDVVAVTEEDHQFVKGVIIESARPADLGALWWTIRDDVQVGLEVGYFDVSKERPVLTPRHPKQTTKGAKSVSLTQGTQRAHGR